MLRQILIALSTSLPIVGGTIILSRHVSKTKQIVTGVVLAVVGLLILAII